MERTLVMIFHGGKIKYGYSEDWEAFLDFHTECGDAWGLAHAGTPSAQAIQEFREYLREPDIEAVAII